MSAGCNIAKARRQRIYIEIARVMHRKCEPCGDGAYLKRPSPSGSTSACLAWTLTLTLTLGLALVCQTIPTLVDSASDWPNDTAVPYGAVSGGTETDRDQR